LALLKIGVEEIDVDLVSLDDEEKVLEFIISSNQQRVKTIIDKRNEIQSLFEKYSLGQGVNAGGSNTIKKISIITGYPTGMISTIRKIDRLSRSFYKAFMRKDHFKWSLPML
jgi:histidyl-tRNA synthetase